MGSSYRIVRGSQKRKSGATGDAGILVACSPREYFAMAERKQRPLPYCTIEMLRSMCDAKVDADKACLGMLPTRRDEWKIPPPAQTTIAKPQTQTKRPMVLTGTERALVIWTQNGESGKEIVENLASLLRAPSGLKTEYVAIAQSDAFAPLRTVLHLTRTPVVVVYDVISPQTAFRQGMKRLGAAGFVAFVNGSVRVKENWLLESVAKMQQHGLDILGLARATAAWREGKWKERARQWPSIVTTKEEGNVCLWQTGPQHDGVVIYARKLIQQGENRVIDSGAYWDGDVVSVVTN